MNNYFKIFFLILCYFNSAIGQNKVIYVNENLELISEEDFNSKENNSDFLYSQYDADTLIIKTKAKRHIYSTIKKSLKIRITDYINSIVNSENKIQENDIIIINYYPGLDECNKGDGNNFLREKYLNYSKEIKQIRNIKQFFFYKDASNIKKYGNKLVWYEDKHNLFEKLFFKIHYPCGSYLILYPNDTYVTFFGEYDIFSIFDELKVYQLNN